MNLDVVVSLSALALCICMVGLMIVITNAASELSTRLRNIGTNIAYMVDAIEELRTSNAELEDEV